MNSQRTTISVAPVPLAGRGSGEGCLALTPAVSRAPASARASRDAAAAWCSRLVAIVVTFALASPALADNAAASRVPKPTVAVAAPGKCVEETAYMLRNHMELLKHHRDAAVHDGVRTTQHSLANCVNCHASKETGRVTGSKDAFCEGCHRYAAVKLDCFECHADRPKAPAASSATVSVARSAP